MEETKIPIENDENFILTVQAFGEKGKSRKVAIFSGKEYIISPLNPRKIKNRGRHVIMLEKELNDPFHENGDYIAKVRYVDSNRVAKADFGELEPVDIKDYR